MTSPAEAQREVLEALAAATAALDEADPERAAPLIERASERLAELARERSGWAEAELARAHAAFERCAAAAARCQARLGADLRDSGAGRRAVQAYGAGDPQ